MSARRYPFSPILFRSGFSERFPATNPTPRQGCGITKRPPAAQPRAEAPPAACKSDACRPPHFSRVPLCKSVAQPTSAPLQIQRLPPLHTTLQNRRPTSPHACRRPRGIIPAWQKRRHSTVSQHSFQKALHPRIKSSPLLPKTSRC